MPISPVAGASDSFIRFNEGVEVPEGPEGRFNWQQALVDQKMETESHLSEVEGKGDAFPD